METGALERSIGKIEGVIDALSDFAKSHPVEDRNMFASIREQNECTALQISHVESKIEDVIEQVVDNHGERLGCIEQRLMGIESKLITYPTLESRLSGIEGKLTTSEKTTMAEKAAMNAHKRWLRFIALIGAACVLKLYAPEFLQLISGSIK